MTLRFIGNEAVVAVVTDALRDYEWLFTNKWQAQVFYTEMNNYGNNVNVTYLENK